MKWYTMFLYALLWSAEVALVGATVYAVIKGFNAWPLVVLVIGFGVCMPFYDKAQK